MNQLRLQELLAREHARFLSRTPTSRALLNERARSLPQGVASSFQSYQPYPLTIDQAQGATVTDADGNEYLDLHAGFGANVFGHAHPAIVKAATEQIAAGAHYAHPTRALAPYAEHLCERFDLDLVRLCNSGTEATMDAIRLARAFTGRDLIVRMEGSYHGHYDGLLISMKPLLTAVGEPPRPGVWANSEGIPHSMMGDVIPLSFNDARTIRQVLREQPVAAVIVEPVLCNLGLVQPVNGYLAALRDACDETGTVLIWDQVKTAATVSWGGAGDLYPLGLADLHCFGKAIGGGFPVGAYGGRADIMQLVTDGRVPGYGTFNGNPVTVAAGLAALTEVLTPGAYERFDEHHARIIPALESIIGEYELPCHAAALGAKGGLMFAPRMPRDYRDYLRLTDHTLALAAWLHLANRGILLAPGSDEQWTLPVCLTDQQADRIIGAYAALAADLAA